MNLLNRLQLDNDQTADNNIRPKPFVKIEILIDDGNRYLPFYREVVFFKFAGQRDFIDRLE